MSASIFTGPTMTDSTPSPILEKMARAIADQAEAADVAVVGNHIFCGETSCDDIWLSTTDLAKAALISLLPLDEEGVDVATEAVIRHDPNIGRYVNSGSIEDALTAFINHALGGK